MTLTPACPRCQYSLVGDVGRWHDSCPLRGACPECGAAFGWGEAHSPGWRTPWAIDVPVSRHLLLVRWMATTLRLFHPASFWRHSAGLPLAPRRLVLWLILTLVFFHVINVAAVAALSWEYIFQSWWRSAGTMTEILASPYYDMGEMNAKGVMEPLFIADRLRAALAASSVAVAGIALALGAGRGGGARGTRDALQRAVVYGMMPLVFMYLLCAGGAGVILLCEKLGWSAQWWYGWPRPTGRVPGGAVWTRRAVDLLSIAWTAAWWWNAAGVFLPARPRWVRGVCAATPIAIALAFYVQFLSYWNRWWML